MFRTKHTRIRYPCNKQFNNATYSNSPFNIIFRFREHAEGNNSVSYINNSLALDIDLNYFEVKVNIHKEYGDSILFHIQ